MGLIDILFTTLFAATGILINLSYLMHVTFKDGDKLYYYSLIHTAIFMLWVFLLLDVLLFHNYLLITLFISSLFIFKYKGVFYNAYKQRYARQP